MQKSESSEVPLVNRTVAEIKEELRVYGLRVTGTKKELIERVMKDCTRRRAHVGRARRTLSLPIPSPLPLLTPSPTHATRRRH